MVYLVLQYRSERVYSWFAQIIPIFIAVKLSPGGKS